MIKFYDVDEDYIKYLKQYDKQIPDVKYTSHNKFVCGIVLDIDGIKYYAPVSHLTNKQQTNIPIMDKGNVISTIRFSFMFPAFDEVLTVKDFKSIRETDSKYADLLQTEYTYCSLNKELIFQKAMSVYNIGCNKNHKLNYTCCDFKLLETIYKDFKNNLLEELNPVKTEDEEELEELDA